MTRRQRLKRFFKLASFTLTLTVIAVGGVLPAGLSYIAMSTMLNHGCSDRSEPITAYLSDPESAEPFTFSPIEGMALDGWFIRGTNGAGVIVLSGAWGGHNTMYEEAVLLHNAGYSVMTYDTRSCADPQHRTSLGYTEITDLQAALDLMSQHPEVDPDRIGVFGFSMGGATVIMTAARDERIKAVVASGNYADLADEIRRESVGEPNLWERWFIRFWVEKSYEWGSGVNLDNVRPIAVIGKISPRPILLIHGSEELETSRGDEQFQAAGEPKELVIIEGSGHGGYTHHDFETYSSRIIAFYDHYLLGKLP